MKAPWLHPQRMIVSTLAITAVLAFPRINAIAQTFPSMPLSLSQANAQRQMTPQEMHQQHQLSLGQMQQMIEQMQETMAEMTPEEIKAMSQHHEHIMMQMQQMMTNMEQMQQMMNHSSHNGNMHGTQSH